MEQAARVMGAMAAVEPIRSRPNALGCVVTLEVTDPDVLAELRRFPEGTDRDRHALAALRVGVLAIRAAGGQLDVASIREAGQAVVSEVRELLTARATEMHERLGATFTHYLDGQSGALPQRLDALVRADGELERILRTHLGADDSVLARSLARHIGEDSPLLKLLSPTEANGLLAQVASTVQEALSEQRLVILREFSLDEKDSALSRLVGEFSLDDDHSAMNRLSKILTSATDRIGRNLTLDDDGSALSRLKRELQATIDRLVRDNAEFHTQMREAIAKIDTRKKADAVTPRHGLEFEARLGEVIAAEAQRLGDVHEPTGDAPGLIKHCKIGDHVVALGADSVAAKARIVWEAKDKRGVSVRAALDEIGDARRNRQAQIGVFVFSAQTAPASLSTLQRYGSDILVVWDSNDPASDLVLRVAYSLARALAVRERESDQTSQAAVAEIERASRAIEKQVSYLDDVRKWAETVRGHGEKIADRSARMVEELAREVERLDAQVAAMRAACD